MPKLRTLLALLLVSSTAAACVDISDLLGKKEEKKSSRDDDDDDDDDDKKSKKKKKKKKSDDSKEEAKDDGKPKDGYLGDTGFRPKEHGYAFRNTGGRFPLTPPVVNEKVMVKLFGKSSCVGGDVEGCKLTPAADEWAFMINRAMNGGQCEGMAVSALTFFKGHDKPSAFMTGADSVHDLQREQVTPLIGYYWAYQAVNPVMTHVYKSRFTSTPVSVENQLIEMWKKGELATLGFWAPPGQSGGHAVTPYAVEDKGNGIHHILIYDNNYPDMDRYIAIDHNANTWKYDVAAINPDVPKMPWGGNAESKSLVVIPLDLRLKKAECPFCKKKKKKKTVVPRSAAITITDDQGRRLGMDGDKEVNEIPDAEVIDLAAFLEGADASSSKMYILPDESDYDIEIAGTSDKAEGDDNGVTVFGDGTAFTVTGVKNKKGEKDVLSVGRSEDGVRYKPATGRMPGLKISVDDDNGDGGMQVQVGGMKSDADDGEVELKLDRTTKRVRLGGGGKSTESYDLKIRHVAKGEPDDVHEEKGIKFKRGESHDIDAKKPKLAPGVKRPPLKIGKGTFVARPKPPKKVVPKTDPPKAGQPSGTPPKPGPGTPPAPSTPKGAGPVIRR